MAGLRVHFVMPADLVARIDAARGEGSRGEFVRRAVEQALEGVESSASLVKMMQEREKPNTVAGASEAIRGVYSPEQPSGRVHLPTCRCPVCS